MKSITHLTAIMILIGIFETIHPSGYINRFFKFFIIQIHINIPTCGVYLRSIFKNIFKAPPGGSGQYNG